MNLTAIRAASDGTTLKDEEVNGLQLRCRDGRKTWQLYYRTHYGKKRVARIGDFPSILPGPARDVARKWLLEIATGGDPLESKVQKRRAETVGDLCDRYLKEFSEKKSAHKEKEHVENTIRPRWGSQKVEQITKADLLALRGDLEETPVKFNRIRSLISTMWKFGDYPSVVTGVRRYKERKRRRYLSSEELVRLAGALHQLENQYPHQVAGIRLLMLTGARMSEIFKARREWYADGVLHLSEHKTVEDMGQKDIHFSPEAQAIVDSIDPRGGWLVGFHSYPTAAWYDAVEKAKLDDFRLHDLRHNFASVGLSNGMTLAQIGELLGHKDPQTTARYAHLIDEKKRQAAHSIGSAISAGMIPQAAE